MINFGFILMERYSFQVMTIRCFLLNTNLTVSIFLLSRGAEIVIVGSSYIERLDAFIKERDLAIPDNVRLVGRSGLTLARVRPLLEEEISKGGHGTIVVHAGANDIGNGTKEKNWILEVEALLRFSKLHFKNYKMVWSDMTPRTNWRKQKTVKMEKKRKRSNKRARKFFYELGHGVISHQEIQVNPELIHSDGVHLSDEGQIVFWNDFKRFFNF